MSPECKIINNNTITNTTTITRHRYGTASYFMNLLVFMDQYLFVAIGELCHYRKLQEEVPDCSNQVVFVCLRNANTRQLTRVRDFDETHYAWHSHHIRLLRLTACLLNSAVDVSGFIF